MRRRREHIWLMPNGRCRAVIVESRRGVVSARYDLLVELLLAAGAREVAA